MISDRRFFPGPWRNITGLAGLCFFCLIISTSWAFGFSGGRIESYSAEQVMISPDGAVVSTLKLYFTPKAYRVDGMPGMPFAGQPNRPRANLTTLGFPEENKEYLYNHDSKRVFEVDLDEESMQFSKWYKDAKVEKVLGKEDVSGYACIKKRVTSTITMMGTDITSSHTIWQADQFEMPLRMINEEGYTTELRNIDTKTPSSKLFQRPTGYQKAANMMAVMGMDFSGMDTDEDVSQMGEGEGGGTPKNLTEGIGDAFRKGVGDLFGR